MFTLIHIQILYISSSRSAIFALVFIADGVRQFQLKRKKKSFNGKRNPPRIWGEYNGHPKFDFSHRHFGFLEIDWHTVGQIHQKCK